MTPETIYDVFSFLHRGGVGTLVFWLELLAGLVSSMLLGLIAVVLLKYWGLTKGVRPTPAPMAPEPASVTGPWQEITAKLESPSPSDWNIAVIRADSLFDGLLKDMGIPGQTMGDRLKEIDVAELNSINEVWEAHKIRNRIVHETERVLTNEEARRALKLYEKAFRELGYLA